VKINIKFSVDFCALSQPRKTLNLSAVPCLLESKQLSTVVLLCGERRVKNIVFTSGDGKNHEWRRPRVVFGVPTSENNVFALLKQAQ
jgi:hypothetical protein